MSERMQSLLSRAVDDQQSEQRSLAATLADVQAQIERLAQDVAVSREHPSESSDAAITALSVELREVMHRTGERLDMVARMVAQRGEDIGALQSSLSVLGEQLRAQNETVTSLAGSVDGIGQHVNGIATYLGDKARDDGSRMVSLEHRLVTLQNDMTAVGGHVAGLTESATRRTDSAELDARIRSIVAGALVGTERRLAAHVDEAVLALAEAMLRRRPAAPEPAAEAPAAPEPVVEQPVVEPPASEQQPVAEQPVAEPAPPAAEAEPVQQVAPEPIPADAADEPAPPAVAYEPAAMPAADPQPAPAVEMPAAETYPEPVPAAEAIAQEPAAERTVDVTDQGVTAASASTAPAGNGQASNGNGSSPKVPAAWTTVMPDDDQRRRGWFRSRE
jgi:hypothetical protein